MVHFAAVLAVASAFSASLLVNAHPGGDHQAEAKMVARNADYFTSTARSLAACSQSAHYRATQEAAIKRRSEFLAQLQRKAKTRRSLSTALNTNHKSNLTGATSSTDPATLFGTSPKCLLAPETTAGPYFVAGEYIRNNIVDGQSGLPLYVDMQFVDSSTCKVIPNLYINFWHANSTGVYSGVVASGNGNSNDASNYYKANHRGIYPTDSTGVVQFTTTFPGHYQGRATHIHVSTASGGTVLANNTYANAVYSHVGQIFFDQSLITAVEKLSPYSTNTQSITLNSVDGILSSSASGSFDPFVNYTYINDDLSNGILAWISIAVDTSQVITVNPAAYYPGSSSNTTSSSSPSPTASVASKVSPTPSVSVGSSSSPSPSASKSASISKSPSSSPSIGSPASPTPSASVSGASASPSAASEADASPSPSASSNATNTDSGNVDASPTPAASSSASFQIVPAMVNLAALLLISLYVFA